MKRVCLMTSVHPAFDVRIFHKECKSLVQAGYEVTLLVPHERDEIIDGVRIKSVPKPTGRLARMTYTVWQVYREAVRLNADMYHFPDPELIPAGLLLKAKGKKVIYDSLEDLPKQILHKYWVPQRYRSTLSRLMQFTERYAAKHFSAIITADEEIAKRFIRINPNTITIQNYPLLEEFPTDAIFNTSRYSSKQVVSFGGINRERAIHETIHAMGLLPDGLDARLILGGASDSEALQQEVTQLPGWKWVYYLGEISRQEMINSVTNAAAALILYSPGPNHYDVRSNRFFESLATGTPVITSDFPKWRGIVEGNGYGLTVNPEDPRAIANAIEYLLTHPQEAEAMGQRGREAVEKYYNWESEERKLLNLYSMF